MGTRHLITALGAVLAAGGPVAAGAQTEAADTDAPLRQLIGFHRAADGTGNYHKLLEVQAPQLGAVVLYHQAGGEDHDSLAPVAQLFHVLEPARAGAKRLSFATLRVRPGSLPANLERQHELLKALRAEQLQALPRGCAWQPQSTADGHWTATPATGRCREFPAALREPLRRELHSWAMVVAAARPREWRDLPPQNLLRMQLATGAQLWIELAPHLAPRAVANIQTLVRERYFDGLTIPRVQDNFVVQWNATDPARSLGSAHRELPAEFTRDWPATLPVTLLPDTDGFAPQVGFFEGMPVGGDARAARLWGAHCYGTLGVGRDDSETSGSGAELYVVIGHAPRQLDRNITVVGRVVLGMEHLSALPRGAGPLGLISAVSGQMGIQRITLGRDLPEAERPHLQALRTDSASFAALVEARRNRRDSWYKQPAGHIDLCNVPLPVRTLR